MTYMTRSEESLLNVSVLQRVKLLVLLYDYSSRQKKASVGVKTFYLCGTESGKEPSVLASHSLLWLGADFTPVLILSACPMLLCFLTVCTVMS
jgi:hypothetical protein